MSLDDLKPETELEKVMEKALDALAKSSRMAVGSRSLDEAVRALSVEAEALKKEGRRGEMLVARHAQSVLERERRKPAPPGSAQTPLEQLLARREEAP